PRRRGDRMIGRRKFIVLVSGVAGWPLMARAQQQAKVPRIAVVHATLPVSQTLTDAGAPHYGWAMWRVNLVVIRYSGEGVVDRHAEVARDVVRSAPDLILTLGMVPQFKEATKTIPIVAFVSDPQVTGLSESLSHPGGNITGVVSDSGLEVSSGANPI